MRNRLLIGLFCLGLSSTASAVGMPKSLQNLWNNIGNTQNHCPGVYDYFPEGGLRIFYCHAKEYMTFPQLQALAGVPVYLNGPHAANELNLDSQHDFGHYNPAFVDWLRAQAIPAAKDKNFREQTQAIYDQFMRNLARTYYLTYVHLNNDQVFLKQEAARYAAQMQTSVGVTDMYAEQYFDFGGLSQDAHYAFNGNVLKHAVLFWLRRSLDGTMDKFASGLGELMEVYDPEYVQEIRCRLSLDQAVQLRCADDRFAIEDDKLNAVYKELRERLNKNEANKLLQAQRAWIEFRDKNAELVAIFYRNGTDRIVDVKTNLTRQRREDLESLLLDLTPAD